MEHPAISRQNSYVKDTLRDGECLLSEVPKHFLPSGEGLKLFP